MVVFYKLQKIFLASALASTFAVAAQDRGTLAFVTPDTRYIGVYTLTDRVVSVDIDGVAYKGHFAEHHDSFSNGNEQQTLSSGNLKKNSSWGRAFLFASSSQVLQCQFDTGFPNVAGNCQDAQGRQFKLAPTS